MNRLSRTALLIAATLAVSLGAHAEDAVPDFRYPGDAAPRTRAEVVAELQQARRAGSAGRSTLWTDGHPMTAPAAAASVARTRAEVRAELREALASGEFDRLHADEPAAATPKARRGAPTLAGTGAGATGIR
ncbi:MAG: hypothetical protein RL456_3194 [Pseudomonadota bacterium]|jgi:hypothetical protein